MELRYDSHRIEVPDRRVITLVGSLKEASARSIITGIIKSAQEAQEQEKPEPVVLLIDSKGGETNQVFAIMDVKSLWNVSLITIGTGYVYSAGLFLLQIGDIRLATRHASLLLHVGSVKTEEDSPRDLESSLRACRAIDQKVISLLARRTGKRTKQIAIDWQSDRYFTPRQARGYGPRGLIDGIVA